MDPRGKHQSHYKVYADELSNGLHYGKYMDLYLPGVEPLCYTVASNVLALPTSSQGQVDNILCPGAFGHNLIEMYQSTGQTLMPSLDHTTPGTTDIKGWEIALDQVEDECVEYVPGGNRITNPFAYVAGTDPGVFLRVTLEIDQSDGMDQMVIGWRKSAAYQVPTSFLSTGDGLYTDFVGIGFAGEVSPNNVCTISDLNNTGSTTVFDTGFNWADTLIHTVEVRLIGRKAVWLINGIRCGGTVNKDGAGNSITAQSTLTPTAYTVDSGDTMIPFLFLRQDDGLTKAYLRRITVGQLLEDGLQPDARG